MFTLTDPLEEEIEIEGNVYPLDLSFDNVLRFFDLMDDDTFFDAEKIEIAFEMFIDTDKEFDFETKYKVVKTIVETFIASHNDSNADYSSDGGDSKQYYDLKQDAEYIYASFLQEYGIDLIEQQGKLRWEKFVALLVGLRDNTRFKEIVGIRAAELPRGKGMEEERKRLRKLKQIYALKKDQKTKEAELDAMFNMLAGGK
ncbi:bacteriophage Gp15 family protein [Caenibacillus caldisaponilyticus]|uniref:bacteriophage Gp15 family protein n=1 Tax=Caenibacillus caldisaponilyticus TaxID=1674942 RepID=UPI000988916D|nr:bacteriophage Gp15 family protein [Caenibacillus caldisaponilyticus]